MIDISDKKIFFLKKLNKSKLILLYGNDNRYHIFIKLNFLLLLLKKTCFYFGEINNLKMIDIYK